MGMFNYNRDTNSFSYTDSQGETTPATLEEIESEYVLFYDELSKTSREDYTAGDPSGDSHRRYDYWISAEAALDKYNASKK